MAITIKAHEGFGNKVVMVDFADTELPDWAEKKLHHYDVFEAPAESFMPARRQITMVVEIGDETNEFNPPKHIVDRNARFLADIEKYLKEEIK